VDGGEHQRERRRGHETHLQTGAAAERAIGQMAPDRVQDDPRERHRGDDVADLAFGEPLVLEVEREEREERRDHEPGREEEPAHGRVGPDRAAPHHLAMSSRSPAHSSRAPSLPYLAGR